MTHGCALAGSKGGMETVPFHTPVKSGLPSGPRGAGAVRFGVPSGLRGMPGVGRSSHWAPAGIVPTISMSAATNSLITGPPDFVCASPPQLDRQMVARTAGTFGSRGHLSNHPIRDDTKTSVTGAVPPTNPPYLLPGAMIAVLEEPLPLTRLIR